MLNKVYNYYLLQIIFLKIYIFIGLPIAQQLKNPPAMQETQEAFLSLPEWGRSPRGGNGNPLQCSFLDNPMVKGAWRARVSGVTKSPTQLSTWHISLYGWQTPQKTRFDLIQIKITIFTKSHLPESVWYSLKLWRQVESCRNYVYNMTVMHS